MRKQRKSVVFKENLRHKIFERRPRPRYQHIAAGGNKIAPESVPRGNIRGTGGDISKNTRFRRHHVVMSFKRTAFKVVSDEKSAVRPVEQLFKPHTAEYPVYRGKSLSALFQKSARRDKTSRQIAVIHARNVFRTLHFAVKVVPVEKVSFPYRQSFKNVHVAGYTQNRLFVFDYAAFCGAYMRQNTHAQIGRRSHSGYFNPRFKRQIVGNQLALPAHMGKVSVSVARNSAQKRFILYACFFGREFNAARCQQTGVYNADRGVHGHGNGKIKSRGKHGESERSAGNLRKMRSAFIVQSRSKRAPFEQILMRNQPEQRLYYYRKARKCVERKQYYIFYPVRYTSQKTADGVSCPYAFGKRIKGKSRFRKRTSHKAHSRDYRQRYVSRRQYGNYRGKSRRRGEYRNYVAQYDIPVQRVAFAPECERQ